MFRVPHLADPLSQALAVTFVLSQLFYLLGFLADAYLYTLPVNWVEPRQGPFPVAEKTPFIVLFYPVLRESEEVMRTTFIALSRMDYPADRFQVVAVPNSNDGGSLVALRRLSREFPFVEVLETPPTSDPSWDVVWRDWDANRKAYWWWEGRTAQNRNLPPKKTRQLIYAFYNTAAKRSDDFLVNYIDADSAPPPSHFAAGALGMQTYDVVQAQNVAGNLTSSLAAAMHALDHIVWDGRKYAHMSADGRQPFWVLGKGLFFRASDLLRYGGFHPWTAIEDPEVGMRLWTNGLRLGVIEPALIEEVPETFGHGVTQRKRWVCGFFQSLSSPLKSMGMAPAARLKAWMNFMPCLLLLTNVIGVPTGAWALWSLATHTSPLPIWTYVLAILNTLLLIVALIRMYCLAWKRTELVLDQKKDRLFYMLMINPISVLLWWCFWCVPLLIGIWMYLRDGGLVWERTVKTNANQALIEEYDQRFGSIPADSDDNATRR